MRRLIPLAAALALAACAEMAGVGANAALKGHQGSTATDHEQAIAQRLAADPTLAGLKVSVAVANPWQDGFASRISVLVAGTVPTADARPRAARIITDTIGGDPKAIAILDRSRIEAN